MTGDDSNNSFVEISQNTEKSPGHLMRLEENCTHSNSSEKPSANAGMKNSQKRNNNNNNNNNNNDNNNNNILFVIAMMRLNYKHRKFTEYKFHKSLKKSTTLSTRTKSNCWPKMRKNWKP